jgi:V/A-type H+-transporting ATPase subunit I
MPIEKLKKVHIVCLKDDRTAILDRLYELGVFHIDNFDSRYVKDGEKYFSHPVSIGKVSEEINKIDVILGYFKQMGVEQKGLIGSFLPDDFKFTEDEFTNLVKHYDLNKFFEEASSAFSHYTKLVEQENTLNEEKKQLLFVSDFPFEFAVLNGTEQTESFIGLLNSKVFSKMISESRKIFDDNFIYSFGNFGGKTKFVLLYLKEDKEKINNIIKKYGIERQSIPQNFGGFVEDEASRISDALAKVDKNKNLLRARFKEYLKEKGKLLALRDYYKSLETKSSSIKNALESERVTVFRGFVKVRDINKLKELEERFSGVIVSSEPKEYDAVPVFLNNNAFFKPFEMLIRMFGLPSYFTLDPTPIVAILFSMFFGIALGDAFYGILLVLGSLYFLHKYRGNKGVENFFKVFLYAGSVTIIVGVLTGSVAGNFFPTYFPNSSFTHLLKSVQLIDPESSGGSITFLTFAIALGVFVQLFGIILNIVIRFRRKEYAEGIFNGFGWLLFIPSLVLLFFIGQYPQLKVITYTMLIIGTVLLLLGGWISVRQPLFKPVAALVNIYGIRSSYGITSFLGDALSYSRLFVLGLSTSILASSFNLVSKLIGGLFGPLGIFVTLLLLLFGHALTFLMNSLGAFVHSIRLNFLEFFGRFYDIGGSEFKPIGLELKNIRIVSKNEGGKD